MIRCVRIWTNAHGTSSFEEGSLSLLGGVDGDAIGDVFTATSISFRETKPENALAWHTAPAHQLVLTLTGTLLFETHDGSTFVIRPGDVLLAEDVVGNGHRWRLVGDEPWRRAYVILSADFKAGFTPGH
jgi:quercetin dioxygenase-like cupin family protein